MVHVSGRVPEGWYADPQRPGVPRAERWWNGHSWTAHEREAEAPPPPSQPTQPTFPPPAHTGQPPRPSPPARPAPAPPPRKVASDGTPLADVGSRIGAYLLDFLVAYGLAMPLFIIASTALGHDVITHALDVTTLAVAVWYVYQVVMLHRDGQTLGKKLLKIRVRPATPQAEGGPGLSWGSSLVRPLIVGVAVAGPAISWIGSIAAPIMLVNLVVMLAQGQRRALHDLVAGTVVVVAASPYAAPGPGSPAR